MNSGSLNIELGVLAFSFNLEKVIVCRRHGQYHWVFPSKPKAWTNVSELAQAVTIAKQFTGLSLAMYMSGEYIELNYEGEGGENKGVMHAYVAVDVKEELLVSTEQDVEEVSWKPFQSLLYSPEAASQLMLPYAACLDKLFNFVDRHPELRMEPNLELIKNVTWHQDSWVGKNPREFLSQWCKNKECAEACYNVIEQRPASNGSKVTFCGVCVLPHIGVQVAPERSYYSIDEAIQNAALIALMYLDGAVPEGSTRFCHVIPVGYQIPLKCTFLEPTVQKAEAKVELKKRTQQMQKRRDTLQRQFNKQAHRLNIQIEELNKQQQALVEGGVAAHQVLQTMDSTPSTLSNGKFGSTFDMFKNSRDFKSPRPSKRSRTNNNQNNASQNGGGGVNEKNAVMLVKEYCDKKKWQQPAYQFEKLGGGDFQASVSLPPANIQNLKGPRSSGQKLAKNVVASIVWSKLQQMDIATIV